MFMHSPVERKFNEYLGNIHTILREDVSYLNDPSFINQLLDRMEYIKRNFILMSGEQEDVFIYQDYLSRLSSYAQDTLEWFDNYTTPPKVEYPTISKLKENLFLLSDMFATSQNLIKSFYPVI
ncbi:hypothetical protein BH11BAC1_BH11BAC1_23410 [soil metagenome]